MSTKKDEFSNAMSDVEHENSDNGFPFRNESFRVGVKIPPFWPQEPAVWFAQVEGQFALSNITTDATKFHYVLSQLEHQYAAEIKDIIVNPPATNKYEKLKSELIKRLTNSREKDLQKLLMHEQLGDRKPSQFLRHLQHIAGPDVPEDILKAIWTSRLPLSIQVLITSQPHSSLNELAEAADRVWDVSPGLAGMHQIASTSTNNAMDQMANQIAELTRQVHALTTEMHSRSRSKSRRGGKQQYRGRSKSQRQTRSHSRSQSSYRKYPVCWYHSKFQSLATKCVKPCDFASGNAPGNR